MSNKKSAKSTKAVEVTSNEEVSSKKKPTPTTGLATITLEGVAIAAVTYSPDGTFGWRSHGKMEVIGRDGETKSGYKFKKGFADMKISIAAFIVFATKSYAHEFDVADIEVVDYIAPERVGFGKTKMQDTQEFADALKAVKGLKIPLNIRKTEKKVVGE